MKISKILLLTSFTCINCLTTDNEYKVKSFFNHIISFNKSYEDIYTYLQKFKTFEENLEYIKQHNNKDLPFKLAQNEYIDLSQDEFKDTFIGSLNKNDYYINRLYGRSTCEDFVSNNDLDIPSSLDWRNQGVVTNVKNQGYCGSCWSFSATGAMEGAYAIAHNKLVNISEQQLIDCSKSYGNLGCNGGLMDAAFEYAIDYNMTTEEELPYEAKGHILCPSVEKHISFSSCTEVTQNNELHLLEAVAQQPVSIAIQADTKLFQFYSSGVITNVSCGTETDHGVLIVGYGVEKGIDYWLVKNSWGPTWGSDGYVKLERTNSEDTEGMCGLATSAAYISV